MKNIPIEAKSTSLMKSFLYGKLEIPMAIEVESISTPTLVKISYGIHNAPISIANHLLSYLEAHLGFILEESQNQLSI
jgi:hypothetical protein